MERANVGTKWADVQEFVWHLPAEFLNKSRGRMCLLMDVGRQEESPCWTRRVEDLAADRRMTEIYFFPLGQNVM